MASSNMPYFGHVPRFFLSSFLLDYSEAGLEKQIKGNENTSWPSLANETGLYERRGSIGYD